MSKPTSMPISQSIQSTKEETEISVNLSAEHTLVVTDDDGTRKVKLLKDEYTIGRDGDNDIVLASDFVSRYHAVLRKTQLGDRSETYCITDGSLEGKSSRNGLVLNAMHRVQTHNFQDGDIVTFAPEVHILYLAPKLS